MEKTLELATEADKPRHFLSDLVEEDSEDPQDKGKTATEPRKTDLSEPSSFDQEA